MIGVAKRHALAVGTQRAVGWTAYPKMHLKRTRLLCYFGRRDARCARCNFTHTRRLSLPGRPSPTFRSPVRKREEPSPPTGGTRAGHWYCYNGARRMGGCDSGVRAALGSGRPNLPTLPDLRVILPHSTAALPLNAEVGYFVRAICHKSAKSQLLLGRGRACRMHCRQFPHTLLIASGRFALGRHAANLQPLRRWAGQKSVCWLNASCVVRPAAETFRSRAWRALRMTLGGWASQTLDALLHALYRISRRVERSWHQPLQTGYGIVECIHAHPFIPSIHASGAKPES